MFFKSGVSVNKWVTLPRDMHGGMRPSWIGPRRRLRASALSGLGAHAGGCGGGGTCRRGVEVIGSHLADGAKMSKTISNLTTFK